MKTAFLILAAAALALAAATSARLVVILLAIALVVAVAARCTLFSTHRVRRMRWRIMARLRPGPGFATLAELTVRWSRLAAIRHGRRARPSMRLHHRITARTTEYAIRLGRAQYLRRIFARAEDQTLILSLPRSGKSGMLGDRVIDHPGAVLVTESRPDIYTATAGYRARLGPIEVFNPEDVSGIPSTFRWGMTIGCEDPAEAIRRATDLVGAIANVGEMAWWVEKSAAALAAGMHAAALLGGDMGDVWAWSNGYGTGTVDDARTHPAASLELFGALAELDRPGKTADSIRLTMSKALTWLAIPDIRAMVTGPDARAVRRRCVHRSAAAPFTCSPPAGTAPRARRCSAASPPTSTAPPATTASPSSTASSTPGCCSPSMSCTCAPSTCPPGWPTRPARASRLPPWCTPPGNCATSTASTAPPPYGPPPARRSSCPASTTPQPSKTSPGCAAPSATATTPAGSCRPSCSPGCPTGTPWSWLAAGPRS